MVYSISASSMFSIDENGKHSLEVAYKDSDGIDAGAYSEGNSFDEVLGDVLDQIDAAIADADDARADQEEVAQLQAQIDDLTRQLEELKARNTTKVEKKNNKNFENFVTNAKLEKKNNKNFEDAVNKIIKDYNMNDPWKIWFK